MTWAPWEDLRKWAPFKIDALGLVTLLGAEEVNSAVGRLVQSTYLEYLPLLGAFVIAGNRFTEKAAGFNLYNITQGIHTTDLSAWLTRWMLSQDFEVTRSFVVWKVTPPRSRRRDIATAAIISFILNGFLIALTVLSRDWYGLANAIAMVVSVVVRSHVIGQHRAAIDAMVDEVVAKSQPPPMAGSYEAERLKYKAWNNGHKAAMRKGEQRPDTTLFTDANASIQTPTPVSDPIESKASTQQTCITPEEQPSTRPAKPNPRNTQFKDSAWVGEPTKVLIIQSDSKAVTFWIPNELLVPPSLFIEGPRLLHPRTYVFVRSIGWLVFGVHIVAIGMAALASQLYTVVLLVLPTVLLVLKLGCDDSNWGHIMHSWRKRIIDWCLGRHTYQMDGADEKGKPGDFQWQRECWIGSRLKAEIYTWPASYEFVEDGHGEGKMWTNHVPEGKERSRKRQDLYAWLSLTVDEEESMDKWDLFPHNRDGNRAWWKTYTLKRDGLQCNPNVGPQRVDTGSRGYDHPQKGYAKPDARHRHSLMAPQLASSAFPAFNDHPVEVLGLEPTGFADSPRQMPAETAARSLNDSQGLPEPLPNGHQPSTASGPNNV